MTLEEGAETIVQESLNVQPGEKVVVINDGNDEKLIQAILEKLEEIDADFELVEYPEPETSGTEPPENVAEKMKASDVFIAPTVKSISHTEARHNANDAGARGVTLPGINEKMWETGLQADYSKVKEITEKAMGKAEDISEVRIEAPNGTDLTIKVDSELFHPDTGLVKESGEFSNLPAGEIFTGPLDVNGELVLSETMFGTEEDVGNKVVIEDGKVTGFEDTPEDSELKEKILETENGQKIAEFGFGTNPSADLIDHILQNEKVLGTVHIAVGDNTFCFPENHEERNSCSLHWDFIVEDPTVWFDDEKILDAGEPVFLDG